MGKFQKGESGNPVGRPKGRTKPLLKFISKAFGGESGFWNCVAEAAKNGDQNSLNLLAARVRPSFKARSVCVELNIKGASAREYTAGVVAAVSGDHSEKNMVPIHDTHRKLLSHVGSGMGNSLRHYILRLQHRRATYDFR